MPPRYLYLDLSWHVVRNMSRFRLRAHTHAVDFSIWHDGNGHCDKSSFAAMQNAHKVWKGAVIPISRENISNDPTVRINC